MANFFTVSQYAPFRRNEVGSVSELRLQEDQAFAKLAGLKLGDLSLTDAPERLSIEFSDISIPRALDFRDDDVRATIARHVQGLQPELILAPLAIGDHIDHRIAQAAVIDCGVAAIAFFEDLPYSARVSTDAVELKARSLGLALTPIQISAPDGNGWKRECASFYPSQIEAGTVAEIADYSDRYGQGERYWMTETARNLLQPVWRA